MRPAKQARTIRSSQRPRPQRCWKASARAGAPGPGVRPTPAGRHYMPRITRGARSKRSRRPAGRSRGSRSSRSPSRLERAAWCLPPLGLNGMVADRTPALVRRRSQFGFAFVECDHRFDGVFLDLTGTRAFWRGQARSTRQRSRAPLSLIRCSSKSVVYGIVSGRRAQMQDHSASERGPFGRGFMVENLGS